MIALRWGLGRCKRDPVVPSAGTKMRCAACPMPACVGGGTNALINAGKVGEHITDQKDGLQPVPGNRVPCTVLRTA